MIKSEELRIGNLVKYIGPYVILSDLPFIEVRSIISDVYGESINYDYETSEWIKCEELVPIPISEEWLIRFGLHVSTEFISWGKKTQIKHITLLEGSLYLCEYNDGWRLAYCAEDGASPELIEGAIITEYVHQFQNLYYTLTREELTLNN